MSLGYAALANLGVRHLSEAFREEVMRETGGAAEDCTDEEVVEGIRLLAEQAGIFAETAGGVTVAVTRKMVEMGHLKPDDRVVMAITGNGLKTQEALIDRIARPQVIRPTLEDFKTLLESTANTASTAEGEILAGAGV